MASGSFSVDLSAYDNPGSTVSAVAGVLGVPDRPDASALNGLADHLRDEELLIVLDNCEHLLSECAELTHEVLRVSPCIRVLATSRIPLGTPGEVDYSVEPLPTPTVDLSGDQVAQFAAVRLFLARGRAVRHDLVTTTADLATVARICRELDGLPLAIELAAARGPRHSPSVTSPCRLDDRFRLLRTQNRLVPPRHQTLRATIDWSYELLGTAERELLSALSVFSGGFTLSSVAAICVNGDLERAEELVSRLVDSSLVVARPRSGTTRYEQLQTIREYAAERFASSDTRDELHRSHASALPRVREAHLDRGARGQGARARAVRSRARQRARGNAVDARRGKQPGSADGGRTLAVLARARLPPSGLGMARTGPEHPAGDAEPASRHRAGRSGAARAAPRRLPPAERLAHEGVSLGQETGPPGALAVSLNVLTTLTARAGDFELAHRQCEESMAVARAAGNVRLEALALFILAEGLLHGERYAEVRDVGVRALALARTVGDPEIIALVLARLGIAAAHEHRMQEAAEHLTEAVEHARALGFPDTAAWCCEGLALVAAERGDFVRAARLLGAGESLRRAAGSVVQPAEAAAREATMATLHGALPDEQLQIALEAGRGLSIDDATTEALATHARCNRFATPVTQGLVSWHIALNRHGVRGACQRSRRRVQPPASRRARPHPHQEK